MVLGKLYRKDLNKNEKQVYDHVKKLRHGELVGFTIGNKNGDDSFIWKLNFNGIEKCELYGKSLYDNKQYSFKFVTEYDGYTSKLSNFDYMLIYVMNWYYNCIDEYLIISSRRKKLIQINNKL